MDNNNIFEKFNRFDRVYINKMLGDFKRNNPSLNIGNLYIDDRNSKIIILHIVVCDGWGTISASGDDVCHFQLDNLNYGSSELLLFYNCAVFLVHVCAFKYIGNSLSTFYLQKYHNYPLAHLAKRVFLQNAPFFVRFASCECDIIRNFAPQLFIINYSLNR